MARQKAMGFYNDLLPIKMIAIRMSKHYTKKTFVKTVLICLKHSRAKLNYVK